MTMNYNLTSCQFQVNDRRTIISVTHDTQKIKTKKITKWP